MGRSQAIHQGIGLRYSLTRPKTHFTDYKSRGRSGKCAFHRLGNFPHWHPPPFWYIYSVNSAIVPDSTLFRPSHLILSWPWLLFEMCPDRKIAKIYCKKTKYRYVQFKCTNIYWTCTLLLCQGHLAAMYRWIQRCTNCIPSVQKWLIFLMLSKLPSYIISIIYRVYR